MKVLHILEATLGGTRQYLQDVISAKVHVEQGLIYASHRADSGWNSVLAQAKQERWQCWHVDMRRSILPISDLKAILAITQIIRTFQPDVIHCHSSKAGALGRIAAVVSLTHPKVIYSPHALAHRMGKIFLLIEKMLAPFTTRFCAVSVSEQQEIYTHGLAPLTRIDIISPTIRSEYQLSENPLLARSKLGIDPDAEMLIGVGRLVEQKKPLTFLEIIAPLFAQRPHLRAYWVGDGELRAEVIAKAKQLGIDTRFEITGWSDDVKSYLSAANIVLSTATYESFGYVVAEALAMQRPVVAAEASGIRDILDHSLAALLYQPNDYAQARSLIIRALDDNQFRAAMIAAGKEKVQLAYSLASLRNNLEHLYR